MDRTKKLQLLKETAFELIEKEGLQTPNKIVMRHSLSGIRTRCGAVIKKRHRLTGEEKLSIVVNTVESRFYEDEKGRFKDKNTGKRFSRYITGKKIEFDKMVRTMAHEIAHLRFWNHIPEHHSYTKELNIKLTDMLEGKGVEVSS